MQSSYELVQPARQKANNNQCWWLSLLEVARASGKLDSTFKAEGGRLYTYYVTGRKSVPEEGQLPAGVTAADPKFKLLIEGGSDWGDFTKLLVYGPQWQRMIMFFLLDKDNKCPWHLPNDTVQTSDRAKELGTLLGYLGVTGIAFGMPRTLVESSVRERVNELQPGQRVLVDKTSHSMSGIVEYVQQPPEPNTPPYIKIRVFNQATQKEFVCRVRKDTADQKFKLICESGKTVINWFLPLTIA
jgi:hypothetical protein